jgi:hypothetical protein
MDNLNLIDSTFRRICEIANMSNITIKELPSGCISFCATGEDNAIRWSSWEWENKEQFLLGNKYDMSLFKFVVDEYIPYYSFFNHKRYTNFIDLCKTLKGCECIEELNIKMDLMGI